jgi:hypothetical protein
MCVVFKKIKKIITHMLSFEQEHTNILTNYVHGPKKEYIFFNTSEYI